MAQARNRKVAQVKLHKILESKIKVLCSLERKQGRTIPIVVVRFWRGKCLVGRLLRSGLSLRG